MLNIGLSGRVAETVDAAVSKTAEGNLMPVRFWPRPPLQIDLFF